MISATKRWLFLKISGALLVPLMILFILNFLAIYNQGYFDLVNFFSKGIPLCGVLGGGYNKDTKKLVELHSYLHQSCAKLV